jgi:hypothetical protein
VARSELDIILRVIDKGSNQLKKSVDGIIGLGVALGAAKVASEVFRKAWAGAMEGSQLIKAEKAFAGMAKSVGQDIHKIAETMRDASGGAIDMQTAMEAASRAIKLGVAETPAQFEALTTASINLGAAMGRGPVDAINDIVTGIGRMSPLILDNIGIMTNGGKVFEDYAKSIGTTADKLSDAQKKQSLLNKAIEDGSKLPDAQSTGFEQVSAAFTDLGNVIKTRLVPILEPLARALADWANKELDVIDNSKILEEAGWSEYDFWVQQQKILQGNAEGYVNVNEQMAAMVNRMDTETARLQGMADLWAEKHPVNITPEIDEPKLKTELDNLANAIAQWQEDNANIWDPMVSEGILQRAREELANLPDDALGGIILHNMEEADTKAAAIAVAAGDQSRWSAATGLAKKYADTIWEAYMNILKAQAALGAPGGGGGGGGGGAQGGVFQQHGGTFTVPAGYPNDSFPMRVSSGETVTTRNDQRSYFGNSNVNINNGMQMDAFEELLRTIQ